MPPPRRVDLHAHTVVSDGTLSPKELVEAAARKGLVAIAVTDHDHVGGLSEARRAGARLGVDIVPGIELSVTHPAAGDLHLLGYFVDDEDAALLARLEGLRASRTTRAALIVERLNELGVPITMAEVAMEAVNEQTAVGRPHVARVLVARGFASSMQDAFDRWLADGRPAAVPKEKLSAVEAIRLVHAAGGVAVLAHAVTLASDARESAIRELAALGMDGVEVAHPQHDEAMRRWLSALAKELELVESGGSDFHGENKPNVALGMMEVDESVLVALKERASRRSRAR